MQTAIASRSLESADSKQDWSTAIIAYPTEHVLDIDDAPEDTYHQALTISDDDALIEFSKIGTYQVIEFRLIWY